MGKSWVRNFLVPPPPFVGVKLHLHPPPHFVAPPPPSPRNAQRFISFYENPQVKCMGFLYPNVRSIKKRIAKISIVLVDMGQKESLSVWILDKWLLHFIQHMGFNATILKSRIKSSMRRVATPGGDLLILDGLLTPCAGTRRTKAFTIQETGY